MSARNIVTTYSFEDAGLRTVVLCDQRGHILVYARGERATLLEAVARRTNQRQASGSASGHSEGDAQEERDP